MLTPLYLAGLAALSIPLILHFIRRSPKGRVPFSTLMFLKSSPPTMTQRSRLDHLLLLFIRALAIILIVLAFCRPFFRTNTEQGLAISEGRRFAILIDKSASMRRSGLWQKTLAKANEIVDQLEETDRACLVVFGRTTQVVVGFEQQDKLTEKSIRRAALKDAIAEQRPGWAETNLGEALVSVSDLLEEQNTIADPIDQSSLQIELISDLQKGSQLAALQSFQWPENLMLQIHSIQPVFADNATLNMLIEEEEDPQSVRVRVTNDVDSQSDQFRIDWIVPKNMAGQSDSNNEKFVELQVPAGQSRVVQLKRPSETIIPTGILLSGDQESFDNTFHVAPPASHGVRIEYLADSDDQSKQGLWFYLNKAFGADLDSQVALVGSDELLRGLRPNLVVVAGSAKQSNDRLAKYLEQGGRILVVVQNEKMVDTLRQLCDEPTLAIAEARVDKFALIGEVDFRHPIFVPFADPKFNDFTSTHFWKYRKLTWELKNDSTPAGGTRRMGNENSTPAGGTRRMGNENSTPAGGTRRTGNLAQSVIARFDNGDPALLHKSVGLGELYVLTSGWNPADSQFAVDTKFVPLLLNMLGRRSTVLQFLRRKVGDLVTLDWNEAGKIKLIDPNKDSKMLELQKQQVHFDAELAGVYTLESANEAQSVVVNLAAEESITTPLESDQLMTFGVQLGDQPSREDSDELKRQMQTIELEATQRIWSKLLIAALVLLFVETLLAGWFARNRMKYSEKQDDSAEING